MADLVEPSSSPTPIQRVEEVERATRPAAELSKLPAEIRHLIFRVLLTPARMKGARVVQEMAPVYEGGLYRDIFAVNSWVRREALAAEMEANLYIQVTTDIFPATMRRLPEPFRTGIRRLRRPTESVVAVMYLASDGVASAAGSDDGKLKHWMLSVTNLEAFCFVLRHMSSQEIRYKMLLRFQKAFAHSREAQRRILRALSMTISDAYPRVEIWGPCDANMKLQCEAKMKQPRWPTVRHLAIELAAVLRLAVEKRREGHVFTAQGILTWSHRFYWIALNESSIGSRLEEPESSDNSGFIHLQQIRCDVDQYCARFSLECAFRDLINRRLLSENTRKYIKFAIANCMGHNRPELLTEHARTQVMSKAELSTAWFTRAAACWLRLIESSVIDEQGPAALVSVAALGRLAPDQWTLYNAMRVDFGLERLPRGALLTQDPPGDDDLWRYSDLWDLPDVKRVIKRQRQEAFACRYTQQSEDLLGTRRS